MLYSCGCQGSISISSKLFTTLSITSLENMCFENRRFSTNNPWIDSVLEDGAMAEDEDYVEQMEVEDDDLEDETVDIPYTDEDEES